MSDEQHQVGLTDRDLYGEMGKRSVVAEAASAERQRIVEALRQEAEVSRGMKEAAAADYHLADVAYHRGHMDALRAFADRLEKGE